MAGTIYAAAWRPGTGAQWWVSGKSYADFKKIDKDYFNKGLRLVDLEIHNGKFAGIWRPGTGAQWWVYGKTYAEFKAIDKGYFDDGLRLTNLHIYNGKYAGVWRPGTGAQWWTSGKTYSEFKAIDKKYFDDGLRLVDLEVRDGKYAGVWRPGTGAQWWTSGKTFSEFKALDKGYFDKGLRLTDLNITNGKYSAVWRPGTGAQWWVSGYDTEAFVSRDKEYFDKGLRLVRMALSDSACDGKCMNQVVMPEGSYNYGITRTKIHCPGLPNTCGNPGAGEVVYYRWPVTLQGDRRYARLSALYFDGAPFTLPFTDKKVVRGGTWLYKPGSWHHAIDYYRNDGKKFGVVAAASGTVVHIGWDWWSGNTIVVSHDAGGVKDAFRTVYMHLANGPSADCKASWAQTVPNLSEPRLSQFKKYLNDTGCKKDGSGTPQEKYWGKESEKIDTGMLGKKVDRGAFLGWAGDTAPGGCGCTSDEVDYEWKGGTNTHLHIFFARRDPSDNEWYFIDPYGIYGPPECYPKNLTDPISTPCARYSISWKGGKPQYP
ncbi:M23 family metallopeptidase [Nitrososphaera viennensis]|uniref:Uncharacterized protein n=2 Tax=Nitrososphaera viennensis TaxID=1034015 RepID=A0A060HIK0_9ARCH|nr:M23 family metallopeptidase [Nitrososphaera viennensis]AIC15353.1 hypothetical protein NVIE_011220 [Nitrososphaera viennensis EN76]UVS70250.1 M23 family metallopeptidase [Nitrososphaera viennensis]